MATFERAPRPEDGPELRDIVSKLASQWQVTDAELDEFFQIGRNYRAFSLDSSALTQSLKAIDQAVSYLLRDGKFNFEFIAWPDNARECKIANKAMNAALENQAKKIKSSLTQPLSHLVSAFWIIATDSQLVRALLDWTIVEPDMSNVVAEVVWASSWAWTDEQSAIFNRGCFYSYIIQPFVQVHGMPSPQNRLYQVLLCCSVLGQVDRAIGGRGTDLLYAISVNRRCLGTDPAYTEELAVLDRVQHDLVSIVDMFDLRGIARKDVYSKSRDTHLLSGVIVASTIKPDATTADGRAGTETYSHEVVDFDLEMGRILQPPPPTQESWSVQNLHGKLPVSMWELECDDIRLPRDMYQL